MKLIIIPLFILILLSIGIQMYNLQMPKVDSEGKYILAGQESLSFVFSVTLLTGFIGFFVVVAIVGVFLGLDISIFGSTAKLDQRSQNIAYNALFYGGLWGIFSVLATIGINGLGLFTDMIWGTLIYTILTLVYVLGINQQIQGGGNE
jgi:hypothetical protein